MCCTEAKVTDYRVRGVPWVPGSVVLYGLALLLTLVSACSGDAASEVVSFHWVTTAMINVDGQDVNVRDEGYYQAPDSVRITSDSESPFLEMTLIGSQAWTRDSQGWFRDEADQIRAMALSTPEGILATREHEGLTDAGAGTPVAGEPTHGYRQTTGILGQLLTARQEAEAKVSTECAALFAPIKDIYTDVTTTTETVVGENSGFVYSLTVTFDGSRYSGRVDTSVDQYNTPITIAPPPNSDSLPQRQHREWPCQLSSKHLPFLPVAGAAVFGVVAFMLISAFVFRRRSYPSAGAAG